MPFSRQYLPFIESIDDVTKDQVKPRNIYRITSYKYHDGHQKTLTGNNTTLVFVIGKTSDKKLTCLKLTEIRPDKFFKLLSKLFKKAITEEKWNEATRLDELLVLGDKAGSKIFNQFIKTNSLYKSDPSPYRVYEMAGIKQIYEIRFKKDFLKTLV